MERCEARRLLAVNFNINFTTPQAPITYGYNPDHGAVYANRGNGLTYGWNTDNSANTRARGNRSSPDSRYDTLAMLQQGGNKAWEIAVPNGTYRLHVVAGDPQHPTSVAKLNAENRLVLNSTTDANRPWTESVSYVTVSDGRLTLTPAGDAQNLKLNYLQITDDLNSPLPAAPTIRLERDFVIGTNIDGIADYSTISPFVDLATQFRRWGMPDKPQDVNPDLVLNADNYPLTDAGALTFANTFPSGDYRVSWEGEGTLTFSGLNARYTPTGSHSGILNITIPQQLEADYLRLKLTNINPNNPVRNLHIISPEAPVGSFRQAFVDKMRAFDGPLRFMDWMQTNNSPIVNWSERATVNRFSYANDRGVPYERMIELANLLKKDVWINVPHAATDDLIANLARLFRDNLDPSLKIHIEFSNEIWNGGSVHGRWLNLLAAEDGELTKTDGFGRAAQEMGKQTVRMSNIFRQQFGEARFGSQIRTELGALVAGDYWAQSALDFIAAKYGPPKNFIHGVAVGYYVGVESDMRPIDDENLTLDSLFAWMHNFIDTTLSGWAKNHKKIADQYEIALNAYEAGQHLSSSAFGQNQELKEAAQSDPRMGDIYRHLISRWTGDGGEIFGNFAFATKHTVFGFWGLLERIDQPTSVKYQAVTSMIDRTLISVTSPEIIAEQKPVVRKPVMVKKRALFARTPIAKVWN